MSHGGGEEEILTGMGADDGDGDGPQPHAGGLLPETTLVFGIVVEVHAHLGHGQAGAAGGNYRVEAGGICSRGRRVGSWLLIMMQGVAS